MRRQIVNILTATPYNLNLADATACADNILALGGRPTRGDVEAELAPHLPDPRVCRSGAEDILALLPAAPPRLVHRHDPFAAALDEPAPRRTFENRGRDNSSLLTLGVILTALALAGIVWLVFFKKDQPTYDDAKVIDKMDQMAEASQTRDTVIKDVLWTAMDIHELDGKLQIKRLATADDVKDLSGKLDAFTKTTGDKLDSFGKSVDSKLDAFGKKLDDDSAARTKELKKLRGAIWAASKRSKAATPTTTPTPTGTLTLDIQPSK